MNIGIYGYTDKRPVVYPILKLLQSTGDVSYFTNDRKARRLLEDFSDQGHMSNIFICVSDYTPDEVFEAINHTPEDFDHVVYDIIDTMPENLDLVIYVKTFETIDEDTEFLDLLGDYTTVKLSFDRKTEKDVFNIPATIDMWSDVEFFELYQALGPVHSKQVKTVVSKLFSKPLGIQEKDIIKILGKEWDE